MNFLLLFFFSFSFSLYKSSFAADLDKEVVNDQADQCVISTTLAKPSIIKTISEAKLKTPKINENSYPWPDDHPFTGVTNTTLVQESDEIFNLFNGKQSLNQDNLFKHPVGPQQDYTTYETLDTVKRVKAKVILNPKYGQNRVSCLYMPPGELITFEIKNVGVIQNTLKAVVNPQKGDLKTVPFKNANRINKLRGEVVLNNTKVTWGWPYGGALGFIYPQNSERAIEITVSGCIEMPTFVYGVTDEDEWENTIRKLKAPIGAIDTGNIQMWFPMKRIENCAKRMNDLMRFWRSAYQIQQQAARDHYNVQFGRIDKPNRWWVDIYVPAGEAVAIVGANANYYPPYWADNILNYDSVMIGSWGALHEMGHHHQNKWGFSEKGETTNNVLNTLVFTYTTMTSSTRTESLDEPGKFSITDGWGRVSHNAFIMNENYFLMMWVNLIHSFGPIKVQNYIYCCQNDVIFPKEEYSEYGTHVLTAMKIFETDMLDHTNYYGFDAKAECGDKYSKFKEMYEKLKYRNIKYHPVTCYYTCGYVLNNGEVIETARPYLIYHGQKVTFDFNKAMVQRTGDNSKWGDFSFSSLQGSSERFKEISKGVYEYTPMNDISAIDTFNVSYYDKTTEKTTVCFVKLKQKIFNDFCNVVRYESDISKYTDVIEAYKDLTSNPDKFSKPTWTGKVRNIVSPVYNNKTAWISITKGYFVPEESGSFVFSGSVDDHGAFYLKKDSDLAGNPTADASMLLFKHNAWASNWNNANKSNPYKLDKDKKYYFIWVIYNAGGEGQGKVGCRKESENNFYSIPETWFKLADLVTPEVEKSMEYKPDFFQIPYVDKWIYSNFLEVPPTNWRVTKFPPGNVLTSTNKGEGTKCNTEDEDCNINTVLFDSDSTTEYRVNWWPKGEEFPHVFEIDMNQEYTFSYVKIGNSPDSRFQMDSQIEIRVSSTQAGLETDSTSVFDGILDSLVSNIVELEKEVKGRYMRITVFDNNATWKDKQVARTSISDIFIGRFNNCTKMYPAPMTAWTLVKDGYYVNGRAREGNSASSTLNAFEYTIPQDSAISQIAFIGDRSKSMGTATVYINGAKDSEISKAQVNKNDETNMMYTTNSHMQLLYVSKDYSKIKNEKLQKVKIVVNSGKIRITGMLTNEMVEGPRNPADKPSYSIDESDIQIDKKKPLSAGSIAGIVIGVLVVVGVVIGVLVYFFFRKKSLSSKNNNSDVIKQGAVP